MFDSKMIFATIATVAAVGSIGLYSWVNRDRWDEFVEQHDARLTVVYNDAIAEYPSDRFKAGFRFETEAQKIIDAFRVTHSTDKRFEEWVKSFTAKIKAHIQAIRKAL